MPAPERRNMIWIEDVKDVTEAAPDEEREEPATRERARCHRKPDPYERTRAAVYASGNRWAIENFEATHN